MLNQLYFLAKKEKCQIGYRQDLIVLVFSGFGLEIDVFKK